MNAYCCALSGSLSANRSHATRPSTEAFTKLSPSGAHASARVWCASVESRSSSKPAPWRNALGDAATTLPPEVASTRRRRDASSGRLRAIACALPGRDAERTSLVSAGRRGSHARIVPSQDAEKIAPVSSSQATHRTASSCVPTTDDVPEARSWYVTALHRPPVTTARSSAPAKHASSTGKSESIRCRTVEAPLTGSTSYTRVVPSQLVTSKAPDFRPNTRLLIPSLGGSRISMPRGAVVVAICVRATKRTCRESVQKRHRLRRKSPSPPPLAVRRLMMRSAFLLHKKNAGDFHQ